MYENLLQRYERDLTLRGFSPRTRKTYYRSLVAFLNHTQKDPFEITKENIKDYLYYLVQERDLSASTLRQARCAITYFYSQTLSSSLEVENIPCKKKEKKLPVVFSIPEVFKIIHSAANLKDKTILSQNSSNRAMAIFCLCGDFLNENVFVFYFLTGIICHESLMA